MRNKILTIIASAALTATTAATMVFAANNVTQVQTNSYVATPSNATPSKATPSNASPSNASPSDASPSDATPNSATPKAGHTGSYTGRSSSSGSSYSGGGSSYQISSRWILENDNWYYEQNGARVKSDWVYANYNGRNDWYFFGNDGAMQTGWLNWNGSRYYLNPISDGWKGAMATGWKNIDGKDYFFEQVLGQNQGHMYVNGPTPDGHIVDANGVMVQ